MFKVYEIPRKEKDLLTIFSSIKNFSRFFCYLTDDILNNI
jgi:hypothetical protein